MFPLNILLLGTGNWGKNYINIVKNFNIKLSIGTRETYKKLVSSLKYQGIIIALNYPDNLNIAKFCLAHNIPILIEKPIALSTNDINQYFNHELILVNYIHLFSPYFLKFKNLEIKSLYSEGFNNGPFRNFSPLFDYCHDVSMIVDLLGMPISYNYNIINSHGKICELKMNYNNLQTFSKFGNGENYKSRILKINNIEWNDILNPFNTLNIVFEKFINLINKREQFIKFDLSEKITKILENIKCE